VCVCVCERAVHLIYLTLEGCITGDPVLKLQQIVTSEEGTAVSRSIFQSGGWRFNPRPNRCVLEQDPQMLPVALSTVT